MRARRAVHPEWPITLETCQRLLERAQGVDDLQQLNEAIEQRPPGSFFEYLAFQRLNEAVKRRLPCSLVEYLEAKRLEEIERRLLREYRASYSSPPADE